MAGRKKRKAKSKASKKREGSPTENRPRLQPTAVVRVRKKNPLIERKRSTHAPEPETISNEMPDGLVAKMGHLMDDAPTEIAGPASVRAFDEDDTVVHEPEPAVKPKPRGHIELGGTEAAGALAARAKIERLAENMPKVSSPVLKDLVPALDQARLRKLDLALAGQLEPSGKDASESPKRTLERLLHTPAFAELGLQLKALLLTPIADELSAVKSARALQHIVDTGVLARLGQAEKTNLARLFVALDTRHRSGLAQLSVRRLDKRSVLEDKDLTSSSLVSHLLAIAEGELNAAVERGGLSRRDVLSILITTLGHPARIALENAHEGVLGAIEFGLADASPAECARLWRQLITGEMSAELGDGQRSVDLGAYLSKTGARFTGADTPLRFALQMVAKQSLSKKRSNDEASFMLSKTLGLDADMLARSLEMLYGVPFSVHAGPASATRALSGLDDSTYRVPPVFVSLFFDGGERVFVFDHIDERTYLRSPHGSSSRKKGATRSNPNRLIEDPAIGLESVDTDALEEIIGVVLTPRT